MVLEKILKTVKQTLIVQFNMFRRRQKHGIYKGPVGLTYFMYDS